MRQYNLSVMKPPVNKSAARSSSSKTSTSYINAAKSLDLLRQNIQRNINTDIRDTISKYFDIFFKPGIENIRNNLGPDAVTEDHITNMCRQILEEAKIMYPMHPLASPDCNNLGTIEPTPDNNEQFVTPSVQAQQPQVVNQILQPNDAKLSLTQSPSFGIKRESDTDSEASSMSNVSKKAKKSRNNGNSSATNKGGEGISKNASNSSSNDGGSPSKPKKPSGPSRKHVALWDTNKLTLETLFIMGAKANKALGFAQTRGRLYVKHPGLFKYASDADDKEWLSKNKLMPATGGRAYIMLLEDIEKLAQDNALNVTINFEDIKGFKVPDFILDKMKNYITTWKKNYAEEDEKHAAQRNRKQQQQTSSNSNTNSQTAAPQPPSLPSISSGANRINNSNMIGPPPPPPTTLPDIKLFQQQPLPNQNHVVQQPQQNMNFITSTSSSVMFDPSSFSAPPQPHDMAEFMQIDKPPPYPGQPPQPQNHQMQNLNPGGNYLHHNPMDPIEQAISKGDWSQLSDRSLLQFALQSTRTIGSWDPQDSFDLISEMTDPLDRRTNGTIQGGSGIGETSPLLQISPNTGAHLAAPIGPVSPNCELSAVLDQVSAFQYTET